MPHPSAIGPYSGPVCGLVRGHGAHRLWRRLFAGRIAWKPTKPPGCSALGRRARGVAENSPQDVAAAGVTPGRAPVRSAFQNSRWTSRCLTTPGSWKYPAVSGSTPSAILGSESPGLLRVMTAEYTQDQADFIDQLETASGDTARYTRNVNPWSASSPDPGRSQAFLADTDTSWNPDQRHDTHER